MAVTLVASFLPDEAIQGVLQFGVAGFTVEKLFGAVIASVFCLLVIKILLKLTDRALRRVHLDKTLKKLIRGGLKALLLFVGVIVVLGCLGIPVTSLVALLSVIGLALSLAVQNFLSNVAGGLQLLVSKPFQIGDYVEAGDCAGTVQEIGLFYTKLNTTDNKLVQLPNSGIVSQNIINYSSEDRRQVELRLSASYDAPPELVRRVLGNLVEAHPLACREPAPLIHVYAYRDSAIEYLVRVWCENSNYWTVYFDLMDSVKPVLDRAGIEMTYPHINVHLMEGQGKKEEETSP
ncbi:MAG TPA: mechanosensitive ion channel family protein [Candidatus Enterenecus stercoripullorum]|nr:mechanosensitive ion channel family protein [Candidatus Enterenecus stercoripullorum]